MRLLSFLVCSVAAHLAVADARPQAPCSPDPLVNATALLEALADGLGSPSGKPECADTGRHPFILAEPNPNSLEGRGPAPVAVAELHPFTRLRVREGPDFLAGSGPYLAEFRWQLVGGRGKPDALQFYLDPTRSSGSCAMMFAQPQIPAQKKSCTRGN